MPNMTHWTFNNCPICWNHSVIIWLRKSEFLTIILAVYSFFNFLSVCLHSQVHFLNSFFHRQLMTKGYDGVKRWTKQVSSRMNKKFWLFLNNLVEKTHIDHIKTTDRWGEWHGSWLQFNVLMGNLGSLHSAEGMIHVVHFDCQRFLCCGWLVYASKDHDFSQIWVCLDLMLFYYRYKAQKSSE